MALSPNERKAAQRERARELGLCIVCCKRKARPDFTTCCPCDRAAKKRLERTRGPSKKAAAKKAARKKAKG